MKRMLVAISLLVLVGLVYGQEDIEVSPRFHDFGELEIGESSTITVTIFNTGDKSIAINDISFTEDSIVDYTMSFVLLPLFFSAGGSFDFEVTFSASESGPSDATLQISSSDPDEPVVDVSLSGEGIGGDLPPEEQIAVIIETAKAAVEDGTLVGKGRGKSGRNRLKAIMNMLDRAEGLILEGLADAACDQLDSIYKHMDGKPRPADFVEGEAAGELAETVLSLLESLESSE